MLTIEGNVVNLQKIQRKKIFINDSGVIQTLSDNVCGDSDIVLKDELIFPGFIDLHVHARECSDHSWDYKEDFLSAGEAAINGGVVAFADMPNNPTPPIDNQSYAKKKLLTQKTPVEILLYAATSPNSHPLDTHVPYKAYVSKSVGDLFFDSFTELENFAKKYKDQNVSFHCEDPEILKANLNETIHEFKRPESAETSAVDMVLKIVEKYGIEAKICHASTAESIRKINKAKSQGQPVTAEVTPHHLFFDETIFTDKNRTSFQVNPPIRQDPQTRLFLIEALKKGQIDFLATDHAPHSLEEKKMGMSGLTHLDTYGAFATWLMKQHNFTPQDILRVCSENPAKFFNKFSKNKYGTIAPGFTGSLTVLNTSKPTNVQPEKLKTKSKQSPFEGIIFPGSVVLTVIKGKILKNII